MTGPFEDIYTSVKKSHVQRWGHAEPRLCDVSHKGTRPTASSVSEGDRAAAFQTPAGTTSRSSDFALSSCVAPLCEWTGSGFLDGVDAGLGVLNGFRRRIPWVSGELHGREPGAWRHGFSAPETWHKDPGDGSAGFGEKRPQVEGGRWVCLCRPPSGSVSPGVGETDPLILLFVTLASSYRTIYKNRNNKMSAGFHLSRCFLLSSENRVARGGVPTRRRQS